VLTTHDIRYHYQSKYQMDLVQISMDIWIIDGTE